MKKFFIILSVLILVVACDNTKDSIEKTAKSFLLAYYGGDYEKAKEYSTYLTQKLIDEKKYYESLNPYAERKKSQIEIKKVLLKGEDKALVTYTKNKQRQTLSFQKTDGKWLVDHSEENPIEQSVLPQEGAEGNGYTMEESDEIKMSDVK